MTAGARATTAEVSAPRGSPRVPLSEAAQRAKYRSLVRGFMSDEAAARRFADLKALRCDPDPVTFVSHLPSVDVPLANTATAMIP